MTPVLLVLNAGSSSLKFQVFASDRPGEPRRLFRGAFDGLGGAPRFVARDSAGTVVGENAWSATESFGHEQAISQLSSWLREHKGKYLLNAVGHRVVHGGMTFGEPVLVTDEVLYALEKLIPLAP